MDRKTLYQTLDGMLAACRVDIPEGESGDWAVRRFTVSEQDEERGQLRAIFSGGRFTPAGTYTGLRHRGSIVMSDTPDEIGDHFEPILRARGNVLINGLGLGMVLQAALLKPDVEHVTVVEVSPDVISLVAPHYYSKFGCERLTIIEHDAYTWKPPSGKHFDVVWHDIWPNITSDNLSGMAKLHRKYGRLTDWQGSWCRALCSAYKRRGY